MRGLRARALLIGLMAVMPVACDAEADRPGLGAGALALAAAAPTTVTQTTSTAPSMVPAQRSFVPGPGGTASDGPLAPGGESASSEAGPAGVPELALPPRAALEPPAVGVSFVVVGAVVPGSMASVTVQTTPWASCTIRFATPLGTVSTAEGLAAKAADAAGRVSWSWVVGRGTSAGIGTVSVTCGAFSASSPIRIG